MRISDWSSDVCSSYLIEKTKKEGRGFYSNVRDPNLNGSKRGLNARTCTISLGQDGDQDSPVAAVIWLNSGPGDPLRGRHSHSCDAINLVVEGGMYMDGIWLRPGQAKIVPADTNYGDPTVKIGIEEGRERVCKYR